MAHAEKCPVCNGTGKTIEANEDKNLKCHGCNGLGWITVNDGHNWYPQPYIPVNPWPSVYPEPYPHWWYQPQLMWTYTMTTTTEPEKKRFER